MLFPMEQWTTRGAHTPRVRREREGSLKTDRLGMQEALFVIRSRIQRAADESDHRFSQERRYRDDSLTISGTHLVWITLLVDRFAREMFGHSYDRLRSFISLRFPTYLNLTWARISSES